MQKTTTFLMFAGDQCGRAEEAMRFYTSLFPGSEIRSIEYFEADLRGERTRLVRQALFTLAGQEYMASENTLEHQFTFTPAISLFVTCESEAELESLHRALASGGTELMPPDDYGFSRRFTWVADRFGVSWQLNLP